MPDDKDFREVLLASNPAKTVLLPALQVGALSGKRYRCLLIVQSLYVSSSKNLSWIAPCKSMDPGKTLILKALAIL